MNESFSFFSRLGDEYATNFGNNYFGLDRNCRYAI